MDKILIITGPTATGKTSLGIAAAKKFGGEIISADSRQVYKYMDIGTGKDRQEYIRAGIPVWGMDLVTPDYKYNVSEYVLFATKAMTDIQNRGKLPIIVGGSGQYIRELLHPSATLHIPPDQKLRKTLDGLTIEQLQDKLRSRDEAKWNSLNNSDRNNSRRLVRAIEVAESGSNQEANQMIQHPKYDPLIIGLTAPLPLLFERIDARVAGRIASGFAGELKFLAKSGYHPDAIGYRGETAEEWQFAEHAYARRQLTYLRKLPGIVWYDIAADPGAKILAAVSKWYTNSHERGKDKAGDPAAEK